MQCQPLLGEFKVSFAGLGSDGMRWDGPGGEIWVWGSTGEYTAEGMPYIYINRRKKKRRESDKNITMLWMISRGDRRNLTRKRRS